MVIRFAVLASIVRVLSRTPSMAIADPLAAVLARKAIPALALKVVVLEDINNAPPTACAVLFDRMVSTADKMSAELEPDQIAPPSPVRAELLAMRSKLPARLTVLLRAE
jgi:hypothetical protein